MQGLDRTAGSSKDFEGDKRIVLRLQEQGGHADAVKKMNGGLGLVVVGGIAETE